MFTRTPNHVNVIQKWALNYVANRLKDGISLPKQNNPSPGLQTNDFRPAYIALNKWLWRNPNGAYSAICSWITMQPFRFVQQSKHTMCCLLTRAMNVCIISSSVINHKSQITNKYRSFEWMRTLTQLIMSNLSFWLRFFSSFLNIKWTDNQIKIMTLFSHQLSRFKMRAKNSCIHYHFAGIWKKKT